MVSRDQKKNYNESLQYSNQQKVQTEHKPQPQKPDEKVLQTDKVCDWVSEDLVGKTLSERYYIEKKIANGSMANVYLAMDKYLNEHIVIKTLRSEDVDKKEVLKHFEEEVKLGVILDHQRLLKVQAKAEYCGVRYMTQQYIDGRDLKSIMEQYRQSQEMRGRALRGLPIDQVVYYSSQIAKILNFIHGKSYVHCDIKPANILIEKGSEHAYIIDFGIAMKMNDTSVCEEEEVRGTASYISPEQINKVPPCAEMDIYSLGVLMYEALTGTIPFRGKLVGDVIQKHLKETPISPSVLIPEIPQQLSQIVLKCLAKKKEDRFRSAQELNAALKAFMAVWKQDKSAQLAWLQASEKSVQSVRKKEDFIKQKQISPSFYPKAQLPKNHVGSPPSKVSQKHLSFYRRYDSLKQLDETISSRKASQRRETALVVAMIFLSLALILGTIFMFSEKIKENVNSRLKNYYLLPDFVGQSLSDVRELLETKGISFSIKETYSDNYDSGIIIAQNLAAGEKMVPELSDKLELVISKGVLRARMPRLTGIHFDEAKVQLDLLGLKYRVVFESGLENHDMEVLRTSPDFGKTITSSDDIVLTLSDYDGLLEVPDLSQYTNVQDLYSYLQLLGFQVSIQNESKLHQPLRLVSFLALKNEQGDHLIYGDALPIGSILIIEPDLRSDSVLSKASDNKAPEDERSILEEVNSELTNEPTDTSSTETGN